MSLDSPRLRGNSPRRKGPYPLGQIPDTVVTEIGKQIVHRLAVGIGDITGDDFGTIFAKAIRGIHRPKPLGIADVELDECAWSVKTVKYAHPFRRRSVRLISGRNSVDFSVGITDAHADIAATGSAVLSIWNARVDEGLAEYKDLRVVVLIRNIETREFVIFEEEAQRFAPDDYQWQHTKGKGKYKNLQGRSKNADIHRFTWQFHGSQFTVIRDVPGGARRFSIDPDVPMIEPATILRLVQFHEDWIVLAD